MMKRIGTALAMVAVALTAWTALGQETASAATPTATTASSATTAITTTEVTFTGAGGVVLHGTVLAPPGAPGRRPGLVLLEGAGNRGRPYLRLEAEAYARRGIVTLVYDKRTVGYSTFKRDYSLLAADALAGVHLLQGRADVDPAHVGFWALSEGAFVAPIAASRSSDVAFLITVGAVGVTPAQQTAWEYGQYLDRSGVTGPLGSMLQTTVLGTAIRAGLFPESNFDPRPVWQGVHQPVLAEWGELDRDSVPATSSRLIQAALDRGGNRQHTVRVVPSVNHNLHTTVNGGFDRLATLPVGYGDAEVAWINDPSHRTSSVILPSETAVPDPSGSGSIWALAAGVLIVLCVLVFAFRRRGRSPRAFRWLAVLAPTTIVWTLCYLFFLLVTAGKVTGPVLVGTPVAWLLAQLLGVATCVAAVAVALSWRRPVQLTGAGRLRAGLLTAAGVLFLPWAAYWGLLYV